MGWPTTEEIEAERRAYPWRFGETDKIEGPEGLLAGYESMRSRRIAEEHDRSEAATGRCPTCRRRVVELADYAECVSCGRRWLFLRIDQPKVTCPPA